MLDTDGPDPPMRVFAVLAGTNIGKAPMPPFAVREYGLALDRALAAHGARLFSRGRLDENEYTHYDGMQIEEGSLVRAGELPASKIWMLRSTLACTAVEFGQEAIGFLVHDVDMPSIVRVEEAPTGAGEGAEAA